MSGGCPSLLRGYEPRPVVRRTEVKRTIVEKKDTEGPLFWTDNRWGQPARVEKTGQTKQEAKRCETA